jgi:AraC-like DNA-binding protein
MTDLQIQEIAERLGYSDIGYFSRRFKLLKQQSPSAYRISLVKSATYAHSTAFEVP